MFSCFQEKTSNLTYFDYLPQDLTNSIFYYVNIEGNSIRSTTFDTLVTIGTFNKTFKNIYIVFDKLKLDYPFINEKFLTPNNYNINKVISIYDTINVINKGEYTYILGHIEYKLTLDELLSFNSVIFDDIQKFTFQNNIDNWYGMRLVVTGNFTYSIIFCYHIELKIVIDQVSYKDLINIIIGTRFYVKNSECSIL